MNCQMRMSFILFLLMALVTPVLVSAECSYIQWDQSDFPPSAHMWPSFNNANSDSRGIYSNIGWGIFPYGSGGRHISVAIRSDKTPESAQSFLAYNKSRFVSYTALGRVAELEDTVAEEVYAYRRVQPSGVVGYALLGAYRGNTSIEVFNGDIYVTKPPLAIPEDLNYEAYREAKRLVAKKCPLYRLEPFEGDLQTGGSIAFAVKDDDNQTVDPSKITWSVIQQKSISPYVSPRNAQIGTIGATGVFAGTGIGTCVVRAVTSDGQTIDANITVKCPSGSGDLSRVKELFGQRIPQGPILTALQEGSANWLYSQISPGWATNLSSISDARYSDFTCGGYQGKVLEFLHRMQADPQECSLLTGLEFGPIQGSAGGHHAVVLYPRGTDWKTEGTVFDPWPQQQPQTFTIADWEKRFRLIAGDTSPSYRLKYPTTMDPSDINTDIWRASEALVEDMSQMAGIVGCPVDLLLTDSQGRRSGVDSAGTWHYEIPNTFFMRMPDDYGGYEWYFRLSGEISSYNLQITGTGEGAFRLTTASPSTASAYSYAAQQISSGATASAVLSGASPAPSLTLPGGVQISPTTSALPENCWRVTEDLDIPVPRAAYGGAYYTFRLNYSHDLFWELDVNTFGTTGAGISIPVRNDLSLPFSCADYAGTQYRFTMLYDHDLYWRLDLASFGLK